MKILNAVSATGQGPKGESLEELHDIILYLMQPYNMHHVPSPEMPNLEIDKFFLAEVDDKYVGAGGYTMIDGQGKTTLLAVAPECAGMGVGYALQQARVEKMRKLGATQVTTNADRPASIAWYKKQGYEEIGSLDKICDFGWAEADKWTTLLLKLS